jgi:hypothetical protein
MKWNNIHNLGVKKNKISSCAIWIKHWDLITNAQIWVIKQMFSNVIFFMKEQCCIIVVALVNKLEVKFLAQSF